MAPGINRACPSQEPADVAHAKAAQRYGAHPVSCQIGLVEGLGVPAGGASIVPGPRHVTASPGGEASGRQALPRFAFVIELGGVGGVLEADEPTLLVARELQERRA